MSTNHPPSLVHQNNRHNHYDQTFSNHHIHENCHHHNQHNHHHHQSLELEESGVTAFWRSQMGATAQKGIFRSIILSHVQSSSSWFFDKKKLLSGLCISRGGLWGKHQEGSQDCKPCQVWQSSWCYHADHVSLSKISDDGDKLSLW